MAESWFCENTKMADVVLGNERLWFVLPCLGVELGFGEKTIGQLCAELHISTPLLLLVCNLYTFEGYAAENIELKRISIRDIVELLQRSHRDYLEVRMPRFHDGILNLVRESGLANGEMIAAFCEKSHRRLIEHLRYEEEVVLPHILRRLGGEPTDYRIGDYEPAHERIAAGLEDLKNLLVKYLPPSCTLDERRRVLSDLLAFDHDVRKHAWLEEHVLVPLVTILENGEPKEGVGLSVREQEILSALAHGMSSKQIADKFGLSVHTVMSHRKNIVRKTGVKTIAGLTLYALLRNLVSQSDLQRSL